MCPRGKREDIPKDIRGKAAGDNVDLCGLGHRLMTRIGLELLETAITRGQIEKSLDPFAIGKIGMPVPQQKENFHRHLLRYGAVLQQHHGKGKEFWIILEEKHLERFRTSPAKIEKG
jgi:hypothetical protein